MSMQLVWVLLTGGGSLVIGGGLGWLIKTRLTGKLLQDAATKQRELLLKAKDEALKIKEDAKADEDQKRKYLLELEQTLRKREDTLDKQLNELTKERKTLDTKAGEIDKTRTELKDAKSAQDAALEKVAKLKKDEARELLLKEVEKEHKQDLVTQVKKIKAAIQEDVDIFARKVIATAIGRLAGEQTAESTTHSVHIPSEEMKGRIIGKEGRNIQHFEKLTGADVVIDESPDTVLISSFDPVRRYTAKIALEMLIADGRIQPTRIEEVVKKAEADVMKQVKEAAEQAAYEVGVTGLHPDLLKILGRLQFRTSYGQNQLRHAVEVASIAGLLAQEIGADTQISKKAGLLHDLGKAVDHDLPGPHHHISMDIARKYGLSEVVVNAIGAHHDDIEPKTVEAILVRAADAISGSRPGARRESLESYVKRLRELENVANAFKGVEKSYAIQAGREVRILVKPEEIDDLEALKLSRDIARKIEQDLQYPGVIKVNVIRETRAVEYAK
ncbi:ribonuclease Y [Candidatus Berkelbacteria bacterium]|nr:ribonuclease Y [Candidatus Berkelbacteria bacterium]